MHHVAVSILNYNSSRSTIACVQSLLSAQHAAEGGYLLDVFIADNNSATEDQDRLRQALADIPNVHIQINTRNQGFAAGHNGNLRVIFLRAIPDFVWVLNNDCLVYAESLPALLKCSSQHPEVGIWGATVLESDGETLQCAGGCFYNSWISTYRQYGHGQALASIDQLESVEFDYIAGASLFFPAAVLYKGLCSPVSAPSVKSGLDQHWLNQSFFLYFEELDLARRLKQGFSMAWCKGALIRHAGGSSTGTDGGRRNRLAEYHSTLSALKYTRMYHPGRLWCMAPARYLLKCLQYIVKGDFRLLWPLTRAYRDFVCALRRQ